MNAGYRLLFATLFSIALLFTSCGRNDTEYLGDGYQISYGGAFYSGSDSILFCIRTDSKLKFYFNHGFTDNYEFTQTTYAKKDIIQLDTAGNILNSWTIGEDSSGFQGYSISTVDDSLILLYLPYNPPSQLINWKRNSYREILEIESSGKTALLLSKDKILLSNNSYYDFDFIPFQIYTISTGELDTFNSVGPSIIGNSINSNGVYPLIKRVGYNSYEFKMLNPLTGDISTSVGNTDSLFSNFSILDDIEYRNSSTLIVTGSDLLMCDYSYLALHNYREDTFDDYDTYVYDVKVSPSMNYLVLKTERGLELCEMNNHQNNRIIVEDTLVRNF